MTNLQQAYPEGVCPDCDEPIPDSAVNGSECIGCGHTFWEQENEVSQAYINEMMAEMKDRP